VIKNQLPELSGFARSLELDKAAVLAAMPLIWSNGQVEGQVTRLKLDLLHNSSCSSIWQECSCGFDRTTLYGGCQTQATVNAVVDDANHCSEGVIVQLNSVSEPVC
jgi:hypothetical protein